VVLSGLFLVMLSLDLLVFFLMLCWRLVIFGSGWLCVMLGRLLLVMGFSVCFFFVFNWGIVVLSWNLMILSWGIMMFSGSIMVLSWSVVMFNCWFIVLLFVILGWLFRVVLSGGFVVLSRSIVFLFVMSW
jgi:hypothetical protein